MKTKAQYTKASKTKTFSKDATLSSDTFVYGRLVGGVTVTQSQPLTYRQLQRACKEAGVSARGSANELRKRLWMSEHGDKTPNPVPLTRRQKALQSENDSHTQDTSQDVSQDVSSPFDYETAYAMDTSASYEIPCQTVVPETPTPSVKASRAKTAAKTPKAKPQPRLSSIGLSYRDSQRFVSWWRDEDKLTMPCKNTGWENVEKNIEFILNDSRFWGWVATEHGAAKLTAMGVSI